MAKVYLICDKICCSKTTYAQKLCSQNNAVLLSIDETTLALFGQHCDGNHRFEALSHLEFKEYPIIVWMTEK